MADGLISTRALIEAMLREDATIDAGELYAVADALGMGDQQVRLAIKRLVTEGRFTVAGRGRGAVLTATDATRAGLEPDREHVRLMYAQDRGDAPWDGVWHLAGFAVPESEREARSALRDAILALGGAPVQGGLYVSSHAWEETLRETAREAGSEAYLTILSCTDLDVGGARGAAAAQRLWPLDGLADGHRRLADLATEALARIPNATHAERLALTVGLVAEFTRAHDPDPLLPPELLPPNWIGARARTDAARAWATLAAAEADSALRLLRWFDVPLQPH
ncbi:PaaX family transcriptional regulator C-terminal domain-containing protein [Tsukamurella ocularis]|uniref:PaaX family transcriptional regulator C-terminal domain-containing protein n=1 Tax=Tsukamurella ocularis TaxID=1970234 RepID=UPI0021673802|nr:PaaX family transcriptional regulator C-terminal domain-containing protein [Tsukamurella ocularis]MCS3778862.1 phenylacetic acid degradation operon negative regulatory protein [Tsukamurella ocularis]MCS3787518.1 phenylacetic acid degradation operon negative regulatory protein [Tsukamurella ocularis]MCS3851545.1 phenylacetic acid degradation operon negative regulatory protein [Tsukamurella ocularis]